MAQLIVVSIERAQNWAFAFGICLEGKRISLAFALALANARRRKKRPKLASTKFYRS